MCHHWRVQFFLPDRKSKKLIRGWLLFPPRLSLLPRRGRVFQAKFQGDLGNYLSVDRGAFYCCTVVFCSTLLHFLTLGFLGGISSLESALGAICCPLPSLLSSRPIFVLCRQRYFWGNVTRRIWGNDKGKKKKKKSERMLGRRNPYSVFPRSVLYTGGLYSRFE